MASFIISILALGSVANAQMYINPDIYDSTNFFSKFTFFTGSDPTHGFVEYVLILKSGL
jgi:hypothetical protein